MTKDQSFASADHIDLDPFISSQTRERILNAAIVEANISESFEEYLEIFDVFYNDDIEITSDRRPMSTPVCRRRHVIALALWEMKVAAGAT